MVQFLAHVLRTRIAGGLLLSSGTAFLTVQACSSSSSITTSDSSSTTTSSSRPHALPPLTLYQYQTCPFCSKTRAFLDYYGIEYEVVEVNPIFKREVKFSANRKMPFIIVDDVQVVLL